jgi:vancomycin resistance protein VanJ
MEASTPRRPRGRGLSPLLWLLAAMPLPLAFFYGIRPEWATALTMLPAWSWAAVLLVAPLLALRRESRRGSALVLAAAWGLYLALVPEEPKSLLRSLLPLPTRPAGDGIVAVSLNALSSLDAALETSAFHPDLVLLQESPSATDVDRLRRELFGNGGSVLVGPDAAIAFRGTLEPLELPPGTTNFVAARAEWNGRKLWVVSLRLQPPVGRMDLWRSEAWRAQVSSLRSRVEELEEIVEFVVRTAQGEPLLVGGDFNAVAGCRSLSPAADAGLRDPFYEAGRGWPNTAVNDFPFARIDGFRVSAHWSAERVRAVRTAHSDHRMVVAELALGPHDRVSAKVPTGVDDSRMTGSRQER